MQTPKTSSASLPRGASPTLLFIDYAEADGPFNMGLDAALFQMPPPFPVLRLYGWHPACLTLGRFQKLPPGMRERLPTNALTRRTTGGGAICHENELTYSLVGSLDALGLTGAPEQGYRLLHNAWIAALSKLARLEQGALWIPCDRESFTVMEEKESDEAPFLCFARRSRHDVLCNTTRASTTLYPRNSDLAQAVNADPLRAAGGVRKMIGSAQRRRDGILLQHGSVKIGPATEAPAAVSIAELAGDASLHPASVARDLGEAVIKHLGFTLTPWQPPDAIIQEARRLAAEVFSDDRWVVHGRRGTAPKA